MTNDTSTLNGALNELGETLADNLSQMGVGDATANDGLTTLAGKILDIEPSIAGLELSTSIDCNVSSNKVLVGQQVVFSATLSASYDDTSIEDIDISGVLTGATVLFKTSDGTIIGSGVTDVNGVATYTHTIEEISNITVYSEFEGSTNFSSCISSTTVTVECSYNFEVTVDKKILSAKDNDIATFNCILSDSTGVIVGESIDYQILHNDTILDEGTLTTDNTGKITLDYAATGVGNVTVVFSLRSILQETFVVEDYFKYDTTVHTRATDSTTDTLIPIYDDYSLVCDNFSLEFTFQASAQVGGVGIAPKGRTTLYHHIGIGLGANQLSLYIGNQNGGETSYRYGSAQYNTDYTCKIEYDDGTIKLYVNNVLMDTITGKSYLNGETRDLYFLEWGVNETIKVKDIKIKAL